MTNCAERTALFKAISEGDKDFVAIAVIADTKDLFPLVELVVKLFQSFVPKI